MMQAVAIPPFELFYEEHRVEVLRLLRRRLGSDSAEDAFQETFLRAFRALPAFRGDAKFSSWLYRITLNLCRDWMRRQRRTPVVQPPDDVDLADLVDRPN